MQKKYPKVLIISPGKINQFDAQSVALRNFFQGWPKEGLAHLYSYDGGGSEQFCGHNYMFGGHDRRFGRIFDLIKKSNLGVAARAAIAGHEDMNFRFGSFLLNTGVWEYIFAPKPSVELIRWVKDFSPDVMYVLGLNLASAWLAMDLRDKFGVPICLHTTDDWPAYLYSGNLFSPFLRIFVQSTYERLIGSSSVRLTTGEFMSSAYEKRYGMNFESMMQCDDSARFFASRPKRIVNEGVVSIIYSGAIASGRWESILDLCEAVSGLQKDGLNAEVSVYTSSFSTAREGGVAGLRVFPLPSHEELPAILKGADILFLPESFNKKYLSTTRLSISTKAHLYMMSERPILLYGPACIGVIDYAVKYGWGYVVKKRGKEFLKSAVREMIYNKRLCADIVENARKAVAVNHEASIVRESFRLAMIRAASVEVE